VPKADEVEFSEFLDQLGFRWIEETGNQASEFFLGGR